MEKDGSYCYTANEGASGEDSFTYVAVDPYGNRSEPTEITINTVKNESGIVYADLDAGEAHAAVLLASKGALVGEKIGSDWYFYPEKTVTRSEFLMMAMKMNGLMSLKNNIDNVKETIRKAEEEITSIHPYTENEEKNILKLLKIIKMVKTPIL